MGNDRVILHVDANNFYASVSVALHPEYAGKPLAVAGNPELRHGIILAKSQDAKKYGVQTAEPIWQAKKKCPNLLIVPPDYDEYVKYSDRMFEIFMEYTDRVESFGLDECWLDCTESQNLFGDGLAIAKKISDRIKSEMHITVSIGVSFSKIFAKLGSDYKKPDAITVIDRSNYRDIAWGLPVSDMLMVGKRTAESLEKIGIRTIGDLARVDTEVLKSRFGAVGVKLNEYANGSDDEDVKEYYYKRVPDSVGNGTTMPISVSSEGEILAVVMGLSDLIASRLRRHKLVAGGIRLSVKFDDLSYVSKQCTLYSTTNNSRRISDTAMELLGLLYDYSRPIRAITITAYKLDDGSERQMSLFDDNYIKDAALDSVIDEVRAKYGYDIVRPSIVLAHEKLCGGLIEKDFIPFKKTDIDDVKKLRG